MAHQPGNPEVQPDPHAERGDPDRPSSSNAASPGGEGAGIELAPGVRVGPDAVDIAYSRSSGPGGQNVNKLSTRCQLRVTLAALPIDPEARLRLEALAGRYLTSDGQVLIDAQEHRSQSRNRDECFEKLRALLVRAMIRPKSRRKTRPTRGSVERRITAKKHRGQIKRDRRSE